MLEFLSKFLLGFLSIGLVVFIHELGHYAASRTMKVDVEVLSYGMGPKLFSIQGKKTEFRWSLMPFGGYCRMKGSMDLTKALNDDSKHMEYKEEGSFFATSPWKRIWIYFAGPLTNFLLAAFLLTIALSLPVERIADPCIVTPITEYPTLFPSGITQDSIQAGDKILTLNGDEITSWQYFTQHLSKEGETESVEVLRNGEKIALTLIPTKTGEDGWSYGISLLQDAVIGRTEANIFHNGDRIVSVNSVPVKWSLDVYSAMTEGLNLFVVERNGEKVNVTWTGKALPFAWETGLQVRADWTGWQALSHGFEKAWDFSIATLRTLGSLLTFNVENIKETITGPVSAAETIGGISTVAFRTSTNSGVRTLLYLMSIVSVSLAVGNILPIPTFDGGQILITTAELVKKGTLSPKSYVRLYIIGTAIALMMILAMYGLDIKSYFF